MVNLVTRGKKSIIYPITKEILNRLIILYETIKS